MKSITAIFILLLTSTTPIYANTEDREVVLMNIGREVGWLQATCSFERLGYLRPGAAEATISAIMKVLAEKSQGLAGTTKRIILKQYPDCKRVWP